MNRNSREIRQLNIKSLLLLLLKLPFAATAARVCLHFRPSVFLFGCVVFGRLFALHSLCTHFFAVHSVVIACAVDICPQF